MLHTIPLSRYWELPITYLAPQWRAMLALVGGLWASAAG
jgi:hypothetical protein